MTSSNGQNWNTSRRNRMGKLTPYQYAILKNVWKLDKKEEALLSFSSTCYCSLELFDKELWKPKTTDLNLDTVAMRNCPYLAQYIDITKTELMIKACHGEMKKEKILLQFRRIDTIDFSVCLIWLPPTDHRVYENLHRYIEIS